MERGTVLDSPSLARHHGSYLLQLFDGSPSAMLMSLYDTHPWQKHRFRYKPQGTQELERQPSRTTWRKSRGEHERRRRRKEEKVRRKEGRSGGGCTCTLSCTSRLLEGF